MYNHITGKIVAKLNLLQKNNITIFITNMLQSIVNK